MRIDDKSAHYNYNPWARFGFRWTREEKAEIQRNLDAFMLKAGAGYTVEKERQQRPDGTPTDRFELVRSDTRAIIGSKTVSKVYQPLCPSDLAEAVRPFVDQGWATPDAFFTMGDGTKEVLVLRLDAQQIPGANEDIDGSGRIWYLGLRNLHGFGQASGDLTTIREICENTEAAAAAQWAWKVRHTGDPAQRVKEAVQAWEELKVQIRKLVDRFRLFADFSVSEAKAKEIVESVLEIVPAARAMREDPASPFYGKQVPGASTAAIRTRHEILDAFNRPAKGTHGRNAMDLRNAVTDTLSHWTREGSRQDDRKVAEQHFDIGGTRYKVEARTDEILNALVGV